MRRREITISVDHGCGAERLAAAFTGDPSHPFLREGPDLWTVGRLLSYAASVATAIPSGGGPVVAIRSHSTAFVLAGLLGAWSRQRVPLLVDPSLESEPAGLELAGAHIPTLAPAGVRNAWADIPVEEAAEAPLVPRFPAAHETEVAFFTSGSTGEPKMVSKRAGQFTEQHLVERPLLRLDGRVATLSLVPAFHILGYIYAIDMPGCTAGSAEFALTRSPRHWVHRICESTPDLVVGVPSHYRLLSQILTSPLPRAVYLCSGGTLDPAVAEEFSKRAGWPVVQVYGSTETAGIAVRTRGGWKPFPGLEWRGRDEDGRLEIRSAWQDRPDEWFVTDDVIAPEGETFRLLGRWDSVVKVGGRRFSTGEIVQSLAADSRVEQAHAVVYRRYGEPAVALFLVPKTGASLTAAHARAFLVGKLAAFKVPRTIRILGELPTRGIGKIDDDALRAMAVLEGDGGTGD